MEFGQCDDCGGTMVGDGYSQVLHCEFVTDDLSDREADSGPIFCGFKD
jgi:hypothetical protein